MALVHFKIILSSRRFLDKAHITDCQVVLIFLCVKQLSKKPCECGGHFPCFEIYRVSETRASKFLDLTSAGDITEACVVCFIVAQF